MECRAAGCDQEADGRLNVPGQGWVSLCPMHEEEWRRRAGAVGMGLGRGS